MTEQYIGRPPPEKPVDDSPVDWAVCEDVMVREDDGTLLYNGPKWLRCGREECLKLVTHGQIQQGGCVCGNRRLRPALQLKPMEKVWLKMGLLPLTGWEAALVQPQQWIRL